MEVRIGLVPYRSLGRIAGNMEYYLRRLAVSPPPSRQIHLLVSGKKPVNHQILKMVSRRVLLIRSNWLWKVLFRLQGEPPKQPGQQGAPDHPMWLNLRHAGYLVDWESWESADPQLSFTEEEHRKGKTLLSETLGIPPGEEFVCVHTRDKAYTDSPDYRRLITDPLAFNDFHDADINTCVRAAEWLVKKGIWVVRVGHQVEGPINTKNPMIIDYASKFRRHLPDPEFADVYLQAHCKFCICGTAGIGYFSHIFNVPMCYVHMAPLAETGRVDHDIFILKKYWNKKEERFMTFREMVALGVDWNRIWYDKQLELKEMGIEIVDNNEEEIAALVQEMWARLEGSWKTGPDDAALLECFRTAFPEGHPMRGFRGYMGAEYMRSNRALFE